VPLLRLRWNSLNYWLQPTPGTTRLQRLAACGTRLAGVLGLSSLGEVLGLITVFGLALAAVALRAPALAVRSWSAAVGELPVHGPKTLLASNVTPARVLRSAGSHTREVFCILLRLQYFFLSTQCHSLIAPFTTVLFRALLP